MQHDNIARFAKLFRGNQRSFGRFDPKTKKLWTEDGTAIEDDYKNHLEGGVGLGIVPVMDDGNCWFGAIDIDAHEDDQEIDLVRVESMVREYDLPLMVCRSKSGGAHLYLFGSEPLPAKLVRQILAKWAINIGYPGVEIFPKQSELLTDNEGNRQLGNWINLCWHDAEGECIRYSIEGGQQTNFEYFLELAEAKRLSAAKLVERGDDIHAEAPPCIQKMISNGVPRGRRNEGLYNICIYLKQAFPETWKDRAFDMNARVFDVALKHTEAKKVIASVARRDYRYRCKEEPCRSLCNSSVCITRKFGITPDERGELEMGKVPDFGPLEKINTEPVRWNLYVDHQSVTVTTDVLMDFRQVRKSVAESQTKLIAPMKNDQWQLILHQLMSEAVIIEAPEEASSLGFIHTKLIEFFQRTDLSSPGTNKVEREHILLGSPAVQIDESSNSRCVYFRGVDFIDYLRKNKAEDLRGPNLWMALRRIGVMHTKMRIGSNVVAVWYLPLNSNDEIKLAPVDTSPEM